MLRPPTIVIALVSALAAACTAQPTRAPETMLDEHTGTTLSQLTKPLQLVATEAGSPHGDPFAFAAPFETNRMGQRHMYLWVAVPADDSAPSAPLLQLDDAPLTLPPAANDPAALGIAALPYAAPAPWSRVFVFSLDEAALRGLEAAQRMSVLMRYEGAAPMAFAGKWDGAGVIAAFRRSLGLAD